jgi:hypothetical protein
MVSGICERTESNLVVAELSGDMDKSRNCRKRIGYQCGKFTYRKRL